MRAFLFCFDKFRNTALKHRLGRIAVGNYGFIFLAHFALSCKISLCKKIINYALSILTR